tara:strand:+ start:3143 stop:3316 length:174 start_codon:yes stop_codon:yes gene_type:complete
MKKIVINYTAEIPIDIFDRFCKKAGLGKKDAVMYIRDTAIKASDNEINYIVNTAVNL